MKKTYVDIKEPKKLVSCLHVISHSCFKLVLYFEFITIKSMYYIVLYTSLQADCQLVKIDINCHVQGDVVLECISLDSDLERERLMFRIMFNTAFIRSNILMLNLDEVDLSWNDKDCFPKDFRAEVSYPLPCLVIYYYTTVSDFVRGFLFFLG